MIPLGDTPNPRSTPWITYGLIAANVAVYLLVSLPLSLQPLDPSSPDAQAYVEVLLRQVHDSTQLRQVLEQLTAYDVFVYAHGFKPLHPHLSDLFLSLFLHAGLAHLCGNMLFLWIYGDNVEHRLGPRRYLLAYLGAGSAASLFHAAFDLGSPMPLIGASGAISGILGFYFKWFPHNQVRLLIFFFPLLMNTVYVPARLVLGIYLVIENLVPFLSVDPARGGVAYGAHIGGFLFGLVTAWLIDRREIARAGEEFPAAPGIADEQPETGRLDRLIDEGEMEAAARTYFSLPPARLGRAISPARSLQLAAWLYGQGHANAALAVYRRYLRDFRHDDGCAEANVGAGRILLESAHEPALAYQHFIEALRSNPDPPVAQIARQGLQIIADLQKRRRPTPS